MFNVFLNQYPLVCKKKTKRRHEKKKSKWSTRPHIDRVFAKELESGDSNQFEFWGRLQTNSNLFDKLTTLWMDENRMGVEFRENLKRKPGMLFELPVETRNLTPRLYSKCCHGFDDRLSPMSILAHSALLLSRSQRRTLSDHLAPPSKHQCFANVSSCFRRAADRTKSALYSLLNAVTVMGFHGHENKLLKQFQNRHCVSLKECASYFSTLGGFSQNNWNADEYHPYYNNDPDKLVLVRICTVSVNSADEFHDETLRRDSHTIAIFKNLIFDSLRTQAIKLCMKNLHRCCLGGRSRVFHHASEFYMFTPEVGSS